MFALLYFSDCRGLTLGEFGRLFDVRINNQAAIIENMTDLMAFGGGSYHLSVPENKDYAKIVITFTSPVDLVAVMLEADNLNGSRSVVKAFNISNERIFNENLVILFNNLMN